MSVQWGNCLSVTKGEIKQAMVGNSVICCRDKATHYSSLAK